AEILMEAGVSRAHSEHLLKLFKKCLSGNSTLTHANYLHIQNSWDRVVAQLTPISLKNPSGMLLALSSSQTFPVSFHLLWDWAANLIMNAQSIPHFEWDALWIFKSRGETITCVYHEPWMGDAFWNLQACNYLCSNLCEQTSLRPS
ncbi:hypothetical protein EI94DRAFT_1574901, partial [Lactarius quietus]